MTLAESRHVDAEPVLIVGGGLAGLAAAVGLAEQGVAATLLESRPRLGGRASSFQDAATEEWIDNCQHVTMGCCTNFRAFCEVTGIAHYFRREPVLYFIGPDGRVNPFQASKLPAPFHLAGAFLGLSYLTWRDKLALSRGLRRLARAGKSPAHMTIAAWLETQRQPTSVVERFWKVVLVSALSESLDRIGVAEARKVIVDGFLGHRDAWLVDIPTTPLEQLYGNELSSWLQAHGVRIRMQTAAERLEGDSEAITGVRLKNGELATARDYIVAVPHHRLGALLPDGLKHQPIFAAAAGLESAPISSLHLWFDRPITPLPHAVFVEGLVQWVFNRTALAGEVKAEQPTAYYYQVVISASRELQRLDSDAIRQRVVDELARVFPDARGAQLLNSRQVTEHRAVFSPLPDSDALRPPQQSRLANLQLAGDYTRTGWPATMEGAVRSGFLAAQNILRRRGRDVTLLRPDLPTARLSRWLFGLP